MSAETVRLRADGQHVALADADVQARDAETDGPGARRAGGDGGTGQVAAEKDLPVVGFAGGGGPHDAPANLVSVRHVASQEKVNPREGAVEANREGLGPVGEIVHHRIDPVPGSGRREDLVEDLGRSGDRIGQEGGGNKKTERSMRFHRCTSLRLSQTGREEGNPIRAAGTGSGGRDNPRTLTSSRRSKERPSTFSLPAFAPSARRSPARPTRARRNSRPRC